MSDAIGQERFVEAVVSGVLDADDQQLIEDAEQAGEDIAGAAADLRARFLERVAAARAREFDVHAAVTIVVGDDGRVDDDAECPREIGRYPILRRLGAGGMGVVYAAYDEILDRRLAIKVLHEHVWDSDGRRRERLLREAQAMARVTHPNVITVHEVGTAGEQLFVAMEFVAGPTLHEWLAVKSRSWPEVVAVFRQIAEGLAAIHDTGLLHRDVKPSNVLIGDDGRVRVLDLGLVYSGNDRPPEALDELLESSSSLSRIGGSLTMTGERVGTPAYMSREQFLGIELTPASDIFSLCVALYEALYGVHPFFNGSFCDLQANVLTGRIAPPPSSSSVPTWLHALVMRGLASDPKDRPASMRALSTELGKDPSRTRLRFIGTIATAALAATLGVLVAKAQTPVAQPICDGGDAAIAAVWSRDRSEQIRGALLASDRPYATALASRVDRALDDYAQLWASAHDRTCREHARGQHSDALLDARMACLDRRRQALAETVEILAEADADVVDHAGQMVAKLPRLEACDDLARLLEQPSPTASPEVAALESRLVRAQALANAGRIADAVAIAREVASAAEGVESSVVVEALLIEARASILEFDRSAVAEVLDRALELAIAEGLDALAAEAMIRRLYVRGLADGDSELVLADVAIAEAMLVRAGDDPELRALLLNNVGAIHVAAGQRELARVAFERSLAIKERLLGEDHLELALSLGNLGMLTPDVEQRTALHERMIAIYEAQLGPDHPRTLDARMLAAFHTADPEVAGAAYSRLCSRFWALDAEQFASECELELGRLEVARGRLEVAHAAFERVGELGDERRIVVAGYLSLDAGDPSEAIAELRELIAATERSEDAGWWVRLEQAERRLLLGRLLLRRGDPTAAIVELERAIVELDAVGARAQTLERERLLAGAQSTLARALFTAASDDHERISSLTDAAQRFYRRWPDAYAGRLAELADLPSTPRQLP